MSAADDVPLLDQHCHGVFGADLDDAEFGSWLTEAATVDAGRDPFASLLGLALRRWCAPVLDLPPHAEPERYLRRRAELGWREVTERLLRATGVTGWFVDTGYAPPRPLTTPAELAELGGGAGHEVVRIEQVAETAAAQAPSASALLAAIPVELHRRAAGAVALKTVVGYRSGLAVPERPPSTAAVECAVEDWLRSGRPRLTDRVVLAWLVHQAARIGAEQALPLQVHAGLGDPDLDLADVDPLLLTGFLRATEASGLRVVLLHCWPYHRNAAYLAHVFGHVFVDMGLTVPFVGARAGAVLAEMLELAPFDSVLYSSDGNAVPELHHLGAVLWRRHCGRLLDGWIADDVITARDAERLAHRIGSGNAMRIHAL